MPASGWLPSDTWHHCLHGRPCQGGRRDVSAGHNKERSGAVCMVYPDLSSAHYAHHACISGELSQDLKPSRPQDETTRPSTSALCKLFDADDTRRTSHKPVSTSMGFHCPFSAHRSIICVIFSLPSIKPAKSLLSSPAVLRARAIVPVLQGPGGMCAPHRTPHATAEPPGLLPTPLCPRQGTCPVP